MMYLNRTIAAFELYSSVHCFHKFVVDDCPGTNATDLFGWPVLRLPDGTPQSTYREARIVANHLRAATHLSELESHDPANTEYVLC